MQEPQAALPEGRGDRALGLAAAPIPGDLSLV